MTRKQIRREDFDEATILNLIAGVDAPPHFVPKLTPATEPCEDQETPKAKPNAPAPMETAMHESGNPETEYEKLFLQPRKYQSETTCRIASETYGKLCMIVRILGNNGLSVKAYVNNILNTHLEQYRDEINNLLSKPRNFKL